MNDLPCCLFNESLSSTEKQKSFTLSPKKKPESNALIMQNYETTMSVFQNNIISTLIKIFINVHQFFGMLAIATYFFVKQKIGVKPRRIVNQAELHIQSFNDTMEAVKMYANKAEIEYEQVSSHFKNMKNQIEKQKEILDRNLIEINNLKAEINEANQNYIQQNKTIESLGQELEKNKLKLLNSANKLTNINQQLRSPNLSVTANELQTIDESDEDHICTLNRIYDMKMKMQRQTNYLATILQMINKLDKFHNINKSIDQQTKPIINLKDDLRRRSGDVFANLKNVVSQVSRSIILDDSAEIEDHEVIDESLNKFKQNAKSFIEDVMQNSAQISETSIILNEEVSFCKSTTTETNLTSLEKGIQTCAIMIEYNDAGCQTMEPSVGGNDLILKKYSLVRERQERMRETLNAYKSERGHTAKLHNNLMVIDDLEKGMAVLETQIKEELKLIDRLKLENAHLKELFNEAKRENYDLKNEIAKLSLSEQEKDKKVTALKEDLIIAKQSYEQSIASLEKEVETQEKDFTSVNQKLVRYKNINHHFEEQIRNQEAKIVNFRLDNDMLRNRYEVLNKKFNDAILSCKLNADMQNLKKKVMFSEEEKENYPRTGALQENLRHLSSSNSKEYHGNAHMPKNLLKNVTYRSRSKSSPIYHREQSAHQSRRQ